MKKGYGFPRLFPARGSLVSDIPAGDGKNDNLFYSVYIQYVGTYLQTYMRAELGNR